MLPPPAPRNRRILQRFNSSISGNLAQLSAFIFQLALLAADPAAPAAPDDPFGTLRLLFPMAIVMALFYLMMIRPQKRKEQELHDQVNAIKENDRVLTIGGIYGVVT